jgi:hypothetical protein
MPITINTDRFKSLLLEAVKEAARIGAKAGASAVDSALEDVEQAAEEFVGSIRRGRAGLKDKTRRRNPR